MWIRSQNRKELVKCISFSVGRNFGGKNKFHIIGNISYGILGKTVILGLYNTKDMAMNEFERIQEELSKNTEVYEMS